MFSQHFNPVNTISGTNVVAHIVHAGSHPNGVRAVIRNGVVADNRERSSVIRVDAVGAILDNKISALFITADGRALFVKVVVAKNTIIFS
jgi:hypothetical protein